MAETATYKFQGATDRTQKLASVDLKGLTDGDQGVVGVGGTAVLTEAQVADARASGAKFTKLSDEEAKKLEQEQESGTQDILTKRGADQTDPEAVLAAREQIENKQSQSPPQQSGSSGSKGDAGKSGGDGGNQGGKSPSASN